MKPNKINQSNTGAGAGENEALQAWETSDAVATYASGQGWSAPLVTEQHKAGFSSILRFWLASKERAAGPLLQAVQGQLDSALCSALLFTLHRRMVSNGRRSEWFPGGLRKVPMVTDGKKTWHYVESPGVWSATFADALGAGVVALQLWRAGQTLERVEGQDMLLASANVEGGEFGASGVAWRAMVTSIDSDVWGQTDAGQAWARDWIELIMAGGAVTAAGILSQWRGERQRGKRLALVESMRDSLAAGRGRRAALADKVKHAAVLMIGGASADDAASAAGFKASSGGKGHGGKVRSSDRLSAALTRAGRPVKTLRTLGQNNDEFKAAARRGAAVDLATLFVSPPPLGPFVSLGCSAVEVPPLHPLDFAKSGLPLDCGGASALRPASRRAVLSVAGASLRARRLRGVVRQVFPRPAAAAVAADAIDLPLPLPSPVVAVADGARRGAAGWLPPRVVVDWSWSMVVRHHHFTVSSSGECRNV